MFYYHLRRYFSHLVKGNCFPLHYKEPSVLDQKWAGRSVVSYERDENWLGEGLLLPVSQTDVDVGSVGSGSQMGMTQPL